MTSAPGGFNASEEFEKFEAFFVRHGQSTANAEGVWQGQIEFPLSELGRDQARRAGATLALTGRFSGVYASPMSRASETARIIASELRATGSFGGEVVEMSGLTERHGGVLQGRPYEQSRAENPELIEKFRSLTGDESWSLVGAETDAELRERFGDALGEIRGKETKAEISRVVVVAHGGVLRAFLRGEFEYDPLTGGVRLPNASLTRIVWSGPGEEPELLDLASTKHLESLSR